MTAFSFSGVFNRFFRLLGENAALFTLLTLIGIVLPSLLVTYGLAHFIGITSTEWRERMTGMTADNWYYILAGIALIAVLKLVNLWMVTEIAILRAVAKPVRISSVFTAAMANIIPLIILALAVGLMVAGGLILLVVPGIIWGLASYVAVPAYVGQSHLGIGGAISRSFELTRNNRWLLLLIVIVLALAFGAIGAGFGLGENLLPADGRFDDIRRAIDGAFDGFTDALSNIFIATIYVCLRESKDKMTPDQTASVFS